jgi:hypothetical protein
MYSPLTHRTHHNVLPRDTVPLHAGLGADDVPSTYAERYRQIAKHCLLVESKARTIANDALSREIRANIAEWTAAAVKAEQEFQEKRLDQHRLDIERDLLQQPQSKRQCSDVWTGSRPLPPEQILDIEEARCAWQSNLQVDRIQYDIELKMLAYHAEKPEDSFEVISATQFDVVLHFPNVVICIARLAEEPWEYQQTATMFQAIDVQAERRMVFNAFRHWVGYDGKKNIVVITWNPACDIVCNTERLFRKESASAEDDRLDLFLQGFSRLFGDSTVFHGQDAIVRVFGFFRSFRANDPW